MEKSKRNINVDILRSILAFLIVGIHTLDQKTEAKYIVAIARSAVPMFFILSGYFIYWVSKNSIKKRIKNTCILLICSNLLFAVWAILSNYHNLRFEFVSQTFNIKNILKFIIFNDSIYRGHLWFIGALLYCQVLYLVERKISNNGINYKFRMIIIVVLLIGLIILSEIFNIKNIYYRNFLLLGLPYYFIGMVIKEKNIKISNVWLWCGMVVLMVMLNIIEVYSLMEIGTYYLLEHYIFTIPLSTIIIVIVTSFNSNSKSNYISKIGREYSLYIYLFHVIIIDIIFKFEEIFDMSINQYLLCITTFGLSVLLSSLLVKAKKLKL